MYANTRRIMCLNIHAELASNRLPKARIETITNGTFTTFVFGANIAIYAHNIFKLKIPLIIVDGSTIVYKHFWMGSTDALHISKPKVSMIVFPLENFWLKQLEIYNVSRLLKMTG